jgi:YfiH family protein
MIDLIKPDWPALDHIKAYSTTRLGGFSQPPYDSLNLGRNIGDEEMDVTANRALLKETLELPTDPIWLKQTHSADVICVDSNPTSLEADGAFAKTTHKICVVQTADCLPILLTNKKGSIIMALHCGWRSLAAGILEKGIQICQRTKDELLVWLGPAIAQKNFEVGPEVYDLFVKKYPDSVSAFIPSVNSDRYYADLYLIARQILIAHGVNDIYGGHFDTYSDTQHFFSYRRDKITGRMATLIWMVPGI